MAYATKIDSMAPDIYRYLNFDKMPAHIDLQIAVGKLPSN